MIDISLWTNDRTARVAHVINFSRKMLDDIMRASGVT